MDDSFYRKYLSGMKGGCTCKYYPTCSQYGLEAIEKYGATQGRGFGGMENPASVIHFQKVDMIRYLKEDK